MQRDKLQNSEMGDSVQKDEVLKKSEAKEIPVTKKEASAAEKRMIKEIPDYDAGYKQVCSLTDELLHFLKKYLKAEWAEELAVEDIRPYPNELLLPDYERRIPDLVFEVRVGGEWFCCYLIVQMQSSVDFSMSFRFASEIQGILMKVFLQHEKNERERKHFRVPAVIPILLYNGKKRWTAVRTFKEYQKNGEKYGEYIQNFRYYLIDISQINDNEILSSNYLIDNIIYLDKNRYDLKNLMDKLAIVLKRIRELPPEKKAMFWEWVEHVFAVSVDGKYREQIKRLVEETKGEEGMFKYAITDMIERTIAEGRAKGHAEGRAEGRAEGYAEGRTLESINIVIRKLDQGLSAQSIAYWLEKEESFVRTIEQLHNIYPDASDEKIAEYYHDVSNKKM